MVIKTLSIIFMVSIANSYVFVVNTPSIQGSRERMNLQQLRSRYYNQGQPDSFIRRLIAEKTGFISNLYGQDYDNAYINYMTQIYNVPSSPTQLLQPPSPSNQPQEIYQSTQIYQSPQIGRYQQSFQQPQAILSSNVYSPSSDNLQINSNLLSNVFVGQRGIGIQNVPGIQQHLNRGNQMEDSFINKPNGLNY